VLSKVAIAGEIHEITGLGVNSIKSVLDALATVASEEIADGEDFTVPGIARVSWRYTKPQKKGARWKKGNEVQGFGGVTTVNDTDSPEVKAAVKLKAAPTGLVAKSVPKPRDRAAQTRFLKSKAGLNIARRKS